MTKTPEELTLDWAAEKLEQDKDYYVELITDDIVIDFYGQLFDNLHYPQNLGFDNVSNNIIKRILAPVPTYDEYKAMQVELAELKEKVADQKTDLESARWYQTVQNEDIGKLRGLLKECKEYLSDVDEYRTKNADEAYLLLTRINAALGE